MVRAPLRTSDTGALMCSSAAALHDVGMSHVLLGKQAPKGTNRSCSVLGPTGTSSTSAVRAAPKDSKSETNETLGPHSGRWEPRRGDSRQARVSLRTSDTDALAWRREPCALFLPEVCKRKRSSSVSGALAIGLLLCGSAMQLCAISENAANSVAQQTCHIGCL